MSAQITARRVFGTLFLAGSAMLMLFGWASWSYVHDTASQLFGAFATRDLALYMGLMGFFLLLMGVAFRWFAAHIVLTLDLLIGIGLTVASLIDYPLEADDPRYTYVFSPTREELYSALIAGVTLFLVVAWSGRKLRRSASHTMTACKQQPDSGDP